MNPPQKLRKRPDQRDRRGIISGLRQALEIMEVHISSRNARAEILEEIERLEKGEK